MSAHEPAWAYLEYLIGDFQNRYGQASGVPGPPRGMVWSGKGGGGHERAESP